MVLVNCFQILWPYAAITELMQLVLIAQVSGALLEGWNTNLPIDIPLLCFDDADGEHCPPGRSQVWYAFHWVEIGWLRNAILLPALLLHRKDINFTTAVHRATTYWFYFWKKQDNGWEEMQSTYSRFKIQDVLLSYAQSLHHNEHRRPRPHAQCTARQQSSSSWEARESRALQVYICMNPSKDGYLPTCMKLPWDARYDMPARERRTRNLWSTKQYSKTETWSFSLRVF